MGQLGVSGQIRAGLHPPFSLPLDHRDLSWNLRIAGLMLPGLWLVWEGLGRSTAPNTQPVNLPNTRKEPLSLPQALMALVGVAVCYPEVRVWSVEENLQAFAVEANASPDWALAVGP